MWSFPGAYGNRGSGTEQASSDVVTRTGLDLRGGAGHLGLQGATGALPRALGFESLMAPCKRKSPRKPETEDPRESSVSERKKEPTDTELSPPRRKRSAVGVLLTWCRWWDSNPHDVAIGGF